MNDDRISRRINMGLRAPLAYCLFIPVLFACLGATTARSNKIPKDVYCGPRCVQRVLKHFGTSVELQSLVRQIQWPLSSAGTRIDTLQAALESRGVYTRLIEIRKDVDFRWPGPAVFHLDLDGRYHYVVWLPPDEPGGKPRLWGASFDSVITADKFLQARSGTVLLTSDSPIPDNPTVGVVPSRGLSMIGLMASFGLAFMVTANVTAMLCLHSRIAKGVENVSVKATARCDR